MQDPAIRPARLTDVHVLSALAKRTWADAFGNSVAPEDEALELDQTRSETYYINALREMTILVAERDGGLLGYVSFGDVHIPEVKVRPGDQGLHRIYVDSA